MSLDKLNAIPLGRMPLGDRGHNVLTSPPGSKLFRPDREAFDPACLPFVEEDRHNEAGSCWLPTRPEHLAVQAELGKRYAAAYFIFIARNGSSALPLSWIAKDMKGGQDYIAQNFWSYLTKLLFDFGHLVSARDVEEHVGSVLADDRRYCEDGDLEAIAAYEAGR